MTPSQVLIIAAILSFITPSVTFFKSRFVHNQAGKNHASNPPHKPIYFCLTVHDFKLPTGVEHAQQLKETISETSLSIIQNEPIESQL